MIAESTFWTGPAFLDATPAEYLADPCPAPSLSASIARVMLDQSPRHAYARHPRFGGQRVAPSEPQVRGTLIHAVLLDHLDDLVFVDAEDWRTKAARVARTEAEAVGKTAVLVRDFEEAEGAAFALRGNLKAEGVELVGESEVPIAWPVETEHGAIWCRSLLDHVFVDDGVIYDLKSCRSAHPRACRSHVIEYGYDIQRAAYIEGLTRLRPELAGRIRFEFLFVELEPPYAVAIPEVDGVIARFGEKRWHDAQELWAECLHTNQWRGYGRFRLEAPPWLLAKMEGA
jgi:hypothetical protein